MIHAKIDVKLHSHPKARKAKAAMATWTWALCYIRDHETDGFVPDDSIGAAWVGETQARKDAATLVRVGLWEDVPAGAGPDGDGGWRLCKYADKNETRAEIDERRSSDRTRKRSPSPSGIRTESTRSPLDARKGSVVGIPGSGSDSGSDLESRSREPTSTPRVIEAPANDNSPPPWWESACDTVAVEVAPVSDRGARWLEYRGAMARKHWATTRDHAVSWLSQVIRSEREKASRQRPKVDTRQPLTGPEPEWLKRAKTGTDGTEPF